MYKIPLFDLNFGEEEGDAVMKTIRSNWISAGPRCEELETLFASMLDVKYAVTLANCTSALHLACLVLDIGPDDEVICPSLTFAASVNCIRYVGARPVFCDISSAEDLNIDPDRIAALITPKTKAIVVVHMAGFPADMDRIAAIASEHGLAIIEDACHGPLSEYHGRKLGTIGTVGCFSFFSNKNISTGEGGMIVTNREDLAQRIRLLRSHGMTTMSYQRAKGHATSYDIVELGYNYRMDDLRASIGIIQLNRLREDLVLRAKARELYLELLRPLEGVHLPFAENNEFVSNYIMPIVLKDSCVENRDRVRNELHAEGIQTSVHYPAVHNFSIYREHQASLPVTEYVTSNEITLPMYGKLSAVDIAFIAEKLAAAMRR
ncbi:DegT/DnrJ/EryC1/StrS family aminotransferase [Trichlorobacter lovleyi]|uniref:DegT/DnrJ/EryC1/StrS family aminotransferase n=1 Tax=Trichlorobacter lovleyi TaxID=313985 RepID=UPI003D0CDD9A